MPVSCREFTRPSLNGEGDLFCRSWTPEAPRAVVVIAHGMCEHSGRYRRVGTLLAEHGFAVYMNDHCGHGRSAMGHPGTFSLRPGGFDYVLGDLKTLLDFAAAEQPGCRRVLMGHSMGSILAGIFADRWGRTLDGLVLMGTPSPNRFSGPYEALATLIAAAKGRTYDSRLLHDISAGVTSGNSHAPLIVRKQWLSHNMKNILEYMHDPLCDFDFSASATAELAGGLREFGGRRWGAGVPKKLPVLILAGSEDSGGGFGEGPRHYAAQLRRQGVRDVTLRLIEGTRHEVLNETDTREADECLLSWLEKRF